MENSSKLLDFSSLDDLNIPEIKDIAQEKAEETHEEIHETAHEDAIEEVESLESLEDDGAGDDTPDQDDEEEVSTQSSGSDNNEEEPIDQIAKWGHELGILDFDEEEYKKYDDKEEYFKDKFFEKAKKLGTESLPPVVKDLAEKFIDGVPLDELIGSMSNQQRLENIDDKTLEEDTQLQESLVAQYLSLQDYEEDEIKTKLEKYKDSLLLEDEAKTALKKLKKYEESYQRSLEEQAKRNQEIAKVEYNKQLKDLEDSIRKNETFIPGVTMDRDMKEKLYSSITKRDREGRTELERKMSSKEMQLAVAQFVMQLDGKLDAVSRKATTQAAQKIKNKLDNTTSTNKVKSSIDLGVIKDALKHRKPKF